MVHHYADVYGLEVQQASLTMRSRYWNRCSRSPKIKKPVCLANCIICHWLWRLTTHHGFSKWPNRVTNRAKCVQCEQMGKKAEMKPIAMARSGVNEPMVKQSTSMANGSWWLCQKLPQARALFLFYCLEITAWNTSRLLHFDKYLRQTSTDKTVLIFCVDLSFVIILLPWIKFMYFQTCVSIFTCYRMVRKRYYNLCVALWTCRWGA